MKFGAWATPLAFKLGLPVKASSNPPFLNSSAEVKISGKLP
ncbi:hypothetical protein [Chitinophaga sedimenti]|nr:hypothetical protein [Chitinophaga sedimenti]